MQNVLVTAAGTRVAYSICKSLARHGVKVYAGDSAPTPMTAFSRHCAGSLRYASPFMAEEQFLADLNTFITRHDIKILVPVLEESFCIAKNLHRLPEGLRVALPDYATILKLHDKGSMARIASAIGVAVPQTYEAADVLADPGLLSNLRFPSLIKPKQGGGGWAVMHFDSPEPMLETIRQPDFQADRFLVQQKIDGEAICVCAVYQNGQYITGDAYRAVKAYPVPYGQPTIRETVSGGQSLENLKKLLDHVGWHGVCEADFLVDRQTGESWLLDVNPRFWGSVGHNVAAGVDYPYYYYRLALGETNLYPESSIAGTRTKWLGGDILRFAVEFSQAQGKFAFLKESWNSHKRIKAYDDWGLTDPLPFLVWVYNRCADRIFKRQRDVLPGVWQ